MKTKKRIPSWLTVKSDAELGIIRYETADGSISFPVGTPRDEMMRGVGLNPAASWEYAQLYAVYADGRKVLS